MKSFEAIRFIGGLACACALFAAVAIARQAVAYGREAPGVPSATAPAATSVPAQTPEITDERRLATDWIRIEALVAASAMGGGRISFVGLKWNGFFLNLLQGVAVYGLGKDFEGQGAYVFIGPDLGYLYSSGHHFFSIGTMLGFGYRFWQRPQTSAGQLAVNGGDLGFGFGPIIRYRYYWYYGESGRVGLEFSVELPMVVGTKVHFDEGGGFETPLPMVGIGIGM